MIDELRKAAEMALKYFEGAYGLEDMEFKIKEALRTALAQPEMIPITNGGVATLMPSSEFFGGQPEPEPVAFHVHESATQENDFKEHVNFYTGSAPSKDFVTLYTAPPKREWVGLTKAEFEEAVEGLEDLEDCWMMIAAKLKEKNT